MGNCRKGYEEFKKIPLGIFDPPPTRTPINHNQYHKLLLFMLGVPKVIPSMSELKVRRLNYLKNNDRKLKSKLYSVGDFDGLILQCKPNTSVADRSMSWILRASLDDERKDFGQRSLRGR